MKKYLEIYLFVITIVGCVVFWFLTNPFLTLMWFIICHIMLSIYYFSDKYKHKNKLQPQEETKDDESSHENNHVYEYDFINKYTGVRHIIAIFYDYGSESYKIVDVKRRNIWSNSFENKEKAMEHVVDICDGCITTRKIYDCE